MFEHASLPTPPNMRIARPAPYPQPMPKKRPEPSPLFGSREKVIEVLGGKEAISTRNYEALARSFPRLMLVRPSRQGPVPLSYARAVAEYRQEMMVAYDRDHIPFSRAHADFLQNSELGVAALHYAMEELTKRVENKTLEGRITLEALSKILGYNRKTIPSRLDDETRRSLGWQFNVHLPATLLSEAVLQHVSLTTVRL